jgi:hypothetical protein
MKRKLIIVAGVILLGAVFVVMVRLADQSGYGKPASAPPSAWTVTATLPVTNASAAAK